MLHQTYRKYFSTSFSSTPVILRSFQSMLGGGKSTESKPHRIVGFRMIIIKYGNKAFINIKCEIILS